MVEINNTFLLAGLIIVAVTCIYLLYVSFNRPDMTSFKNNINNMVQQNKKRDEIVNFLLDKVQGLNKLVSNLQQQFQSNVPSENGGVVQQSVVMDNTSSVQPENVDDLMEQLNEGLSEEFPVKQQLSPGDLQRLQEMSNEVGVEVVDEPEVEVIDEVGVEVVDEPRGEVVDESEFINMGDSEFETVMNIVQNTTHSPYEPMTDNVVVEDIVEDVSPVDLEELAEEVVEDVVDNVMEELEESKLSQEDLSYLRSLPQKKEDLAEAYNVKDLREICKRFSLGTYGRKVELAERILNLLN
jgi:hypothetical protein